MITIRSRLFVSSLISFSHSCHVKSASLLQPLLTKSLATPKFLPITSISSNFVNSQTCNEHRSIKKNFSTAATLESEPKGLLSKVFGRFQNSKSVSLQFNSHLLTFQRCSAHFRLFAPPVSSSTSRSSRKSTMQTFFKSSTCPTPSIRGSSSPKFTVTCCSLV